MVVSKNPKASQWLNNAYNIAYIPICYFDGGYEVLLGGYTQSYYYSDLILASGARPVPALDLDVSISWLGDYRAEVTVTLTNNEFVNYVPDTPAAPTGPESGLLEDSHDFSTTPSDPDADDVFLMWDWGDETGDWLGPYASDQVFNIQRQWSNPGIYNVRVKVKDVWDEESPWSEATEVHVTARGDANSDWQTNVGDAVFMINYVFKSGQPPVPLSAGDANCDGSPNVGDAVYVINFVFKNGPSPGCP